MSQCTHKKWVWPPMHKDKWTGELEQGSAYLVSAQEHLDAGRFKCSVCGEVGYYTGQWKDYFLFGIPCPGSEGVPR